ncbi:hypothetical protein EMIHUDRAFT_117571 [Emiliania huxleyi CCMP1516]|uniref:Uncharacterized protein n=2 Tax=Emiliania huxleyi TaxID=2903 RepID=A0A0D3JAW5_EMIH1|nr:hypothetical protein EMIHUDRAFT_117571 [Emiliania huxleyi CCMP1516]EOD20650.1 hypothetical protein EMIHUDRAFT_117571 [Emiliania huxleyi CCMP1516]|eukprot:XP_005773079.1 hypothetical protein EMIHUDRAFT_117571 [Emiliania huxleyi CCMP1516]
MSCPRAGGSILRTVPGRGVLEGEIDDCSCCSRRSMSRSILRTSPPERISGDEASGGCAASPLCAEARELSERVSEERVRHEAWVREASPISKARLDGSLEPEALEPPKDTSWSKDGTFEARLDCEPDGSLEQACPSPKDTSNERSLTERRENSPKESSRKLPPRLASALTDGTLGLPGRGLSLGTGCRVPAGAVEGLLLPAVELSLKLPFSSVKGTCRFSGEMASVLTSGAVRLPAAGASRARTAEQHARSRSLAAEQHARSRSLAAEQHARSRSLAAVQHTRSRSLAAVQHTHSRSW